MMRYLAPSRLQPNRLGAAIRRLGAVCPASSGPALPIAQIYNLASAAGFSGVDAITAAAVALAESGGKPGACNTEGSYGLWQIYLPDHPEFNGWNLYDPAQNAAAAFGVYSDAGGSFRPWTTFKKGFYQQFVAQASQAAGSGQMPQPQIILPDGTVIGSSQAASVPDDTPTPGGTNFDNAAVVTAAAVAAYGLIKFFQR